MKSVKLLVIVFIIMYFLNWIGVFRPVKNSFVKLLSPLMIKIHHVSSSSMETLDALFHFYKLNLYVDRLKAEKFALRKQLIEFNSLKLENERLQNLLSLKNEIYYNSEACKILSFDASNWFKSILINKGSNHEISEKMLAISNKGVVGKVTEVTASSSRVMLASDRNSKIGVRILSTRDIGILEGDNSYIATLKYLPTSSKFKEGDIVISLGQDSFGAEGFYVGEIIERVDKESHYYSEAKVRLAHTDHALEEVLILKNLKSTPKLQIENSPES